VSAVVRHLGRAGYAPTWRAMQAFTDARDEAVTTTEMNIRFLAPVHERVTVTARVLKAGRTLCPIVAELHDEDGTLVAVEPVEQPVGVHRRHATAYRDWRGRPVI